MARVAVLGLLAAACAGGGAHVAIAPGLSAGSVGVPGIEAGPGLGAEVAAWRDSGLGGAITTDVSGYAASGDPIMWAEVQARYRIELARRGNLRLSITPGLGVGYAVCCHVNDVVASGFVALGGEYEKGGWLLGLSLRERPSYFIGGGSPFGELHNSLQLAFTVGRVFEARE